MTDKEPTFTTGQVSGITWLTQVTLYKYTKEFPQYFSSTATQNKKGRRWTSADLETIQTIRTLKHSRLGHDKVAGALATGYRDLLSPAANREEFSRLAAALFDQSIELKEELKKVKDELIGVRAWEGKVSHLQGHINALHDYVMDIATINKLARILGLADKPLLTEYHKKPGKTLLYTATAVAQEITRDKS